MEEKAVKLGKGLEQRRKALAAMPEGVAKLRAQAAFDADERLYQDALVDATAQRDAVCARQAADKVGNPTLAVAVILTES